MSSLSQFSEVDEICTDFEHLSKSSLNGIGAADDETVVKFCSCVTVEELRSFLACEYEMMSYCWTCFCTDVRLLSMTYFCLKRFLLQYKYLRLHNHQLIDTFCIMHVMLLNPPSMHLFVGIPYFYTNYSENFRYHVQMHIRSHSLQYSSGFSILFIQYDKCACHMVYAAMLHLMSVHIFLLVVDWCSFGCRCISVIYQT